MTLRTRLKWGALVAMIGLIPLACGDDDGDSKSTTPATEAGDTTAPSTDGTTDGGGDGTLTIAILSPDYAAQPAAKEAIDAFDKLATDAGHTTSIVDTNGDNAAMNAEITTAVSQGVDAIVIAFGTPQEFGEGLQAAADAGIPVFGLDTGGATPEFLVNVTTDPAELGEMSAQAIIDRVDKGANVAMITFDAFEPVAKRGEAAKALFEEAGLNIVEYAQGDPADSTGFATTLVGEFLVKYPEGELAAVWAGWDATALGAYQATQDAGRTEVLVTGVDGQDFARAEVAKDGNWIATVRQDWPTVAQTVLDVIEAHFNGTDPAEQTVYVPAILITADNA